MKNKHYFNLLSKLGIKEKLISIKEDKTNENATRPQHHGNSFLTSWLLGKDWQGVRKKRCQSELYNQAGIEAVF